MGRMRNKQDLAGRQEQVYPAALAYLARRDYAEQELRQRLLARGAEEQAVEEAVARLYAAGYLDQQRFAAGRARQRRDFASRGRAAVRLELRALGLDEGDIDAALEAEYDSGSERDIVAAIIRRELSQLPAEAEPALRQACLAKLQRRLLARGFQASLVYELLREQTD